MGEQTTVVIDADTSRLSAEGLRPRFALRTHWKRRAFDPAAADAGLVPPRLRVHDLRHTAASLWISSGATVKVVQQQLGHKTATLTLDTYSHLFPDELDEQARLVDALRSVALADSVRTTGRGGDVRAI
jgi:integrase